MFTGIIRYHGKLAKRTGNRLTIVVPRIVYRKLKPGGSISVNGVCLTVETGGRTTPLPNPPPQGGRGTKKNFPLPDVREDHGEGETNLKISVMPETARITTLGSLPIGSPVNLELPLRLGNPLDGHLVAGHVDGVGVVRAVRQRGNSRSVTIAASHTLLPYLAPKGAVAVDGVSLTIQSTYGVTFSIGLIPETLKRTTLGSLKPRDQTNIEIDLIARYVGQISQKARV